jgi:hypothetical protein
VNAARPRRPKVADVRFYVDANLMGVGKILADLRSDVTYPGLAAGVVEGRHRPACVVGAADTPDDEWIRLVAAQGWVILTRDIAIQQRLREIEAVVQHNARMVTIVGAEQLRRFDLLHITLKWWSRIEQVCAEPGPVIYTATRSRCEPIDPRKLLKDARERRPARRAAPL